MDDRLFAVCCNQPQRLATGLASLAATVTVPRVSGWGLVCRSQGEPVMRVFPRAMEETPLDVAAQVAAAHSDLALVIATPSQLVCPPLRYRRWFGVAHATLPQAVLNVMRNAIPAHVRSAVANETAAGTLFQHAVTQLERPASGARADDEVIAMFARLRVDIGSGGVTLLLSDGLSLFATALNPSAPLFMRRLKGAGEFRGVLVCNADTVPGPGFEPLGATSLLVVHRDLNTRIISI